MGRCFVCILVYIMFYKASHTYEQCWELDVTYFCKHVFSIINGVAVLGTISDTCVVPEAHETFFRSPQWPP